MPCYTTLVSTIPIYQFYQTLFLLFFYSRFQMNTITNRFRVRTFPLTMIRPVFPATRDAPNVESSTNIDETRRRGWVKTRQGAVERNYTREERMLNAAKLSPWTEANDRKRKNVIDTRISDRGSTATWSRNCHWQQFRKHWP